MFESKKLLNQIADKTNEIDNKTNLTTQSLTFLGKSFEEHKYADVKSRDKRQLWEEQITSSLSACPESIRIETKEKEQNGKLGVLAKEVAETRGTVKIWCYIFSVLILASMVGTIIAAYISKK